MFYTVDRDKEGNIINFRLVSEEDIKAKNYDFHVFTSIEDGLERFTDNLLHEIKEGLDKGTVKDPYLASLAEFILKYRENKFDKVDYIKYRAAVLDNS